MMTIGKGKVSTILSDGTYAYKTYPASYRTEWIRAEEAIHHELSSKTDLPVPECTFIAKTRQLRMALIDGMTLADRIRKETYKEGLLDLVRLQMMTYRYRDLDLEDAFLVYETRLKNASLDPGLRTIALDALNRIGRIRVLCHFDFHFENIMVDRTGYHIIDWVNAMLGNPVMDIARTYVILRQYAVRMSGPYLKMITKEISIDPKEVMKAVPLMAVLRMAEDDTGAFRSVLETLVKETSESGNPKS